MNILFRRGRNAIIKADRYLKETYLNHKLKSGLKNGSLIELDIVKSEEIGIPVGVFKPETKETIKIMRTFGVIDQGSFDITYPQINLNVFNNVIVVSKTDFIISGQKVYWPKYFNYNFNKNIPLDCTLKWVNSTDNKVIVKDVKPSVVVDVAYSLLGVHAQIWSHSLSEYYTKLSQLDKVLEIEKGTVNLLVPNYKDQQLKQIVYDYVRNYDRINIIPIEDGCAVSVGKLYYMERPAAFTDHETYVAIGDNAQPKIVSDILKRDLVEPLIRGMEDSSYPKKLFLVRRGFYRALTNNDEVEEFFKSEGFYFLEPHKVTLEEKIKLFYNAEMIVGSYSSAFSNVLFCKPGTKALLFSNYQRIFETWLSMHYQHFDIDMMFVTGSDVKKENSAHTSFYISLDRIKAACKHIGIIE